MLKFFGVVTAVREPELKEVNNTHICNIRVASNHPVGSDENKKVNSYFFDLVLWDSGAKTVAEMVKLGDRLYVEGIPQENTWVDAEGKRHSKVVFRVSSFTPIPKKEKTEQ